MKVLVTGGAGYIGSHTVVALVEAGHEPFIVDNFSNSKPSVIDNLKTITGMEIPFRNVELTDPSAVEILFKENEFDSVIHFAALKAVGESVEQPLRYYHNNLLSLINILTSMKTHNVQTFIFSSSATVYGAPLKVPITEEEPLKATNPYGQTKLMGEQIVRDTFSSFGTSLLLRYFNPVGAHQSGLIGEDPMGIPNNLVPYMLKVAAGQLEQLTVFGDDYDTKDGTGVRDYIHVMDLAEGHVAALNKKDQGVYAYNLGTGVGYSVKEIISTLEKVSGNAVPYKIGPRRSGDIGVCYSDPGLANKELGWSASRDLLTMCEDSWRWQQNSTKTS